jgi:ferredoxin
MAYLEELTELSERIEIVPEVERGIPDLATALAAAPAGTAVYCCGPEAMISATRKLCSDHLKDGELYIERFGAAKKVDDPLPDSSTETGGEITVELVRSGLILQIPADRSILDVILKALPGTRYSCGEGYCGACEVKVLEGTPDHRDDILTDEERLTGDSMMICVSRAESPTLKLDL